MKLSPTRFVAIALLLFTAGYVLAQDGSDGGSGDGFGDGFGTDFGSDSFGSAGAGLETGGTLRLVNRLFPDFDDPASSILEAWPSLVLTVGAENDYGSFSAELAFDGALLGAGAIPVIPGVSAAPSPVPYLSQLVREASVHIYGSVVSAEIGLVRRVWGKGDELHVIDVLNATDYSDPGSGGYVASRIAAPMVILEIPFRLQGLFEAAYLPLFVADRIPVSGRWAPTQYAELLALSAAGVAVTGPPPKTTLGDYQVGFRVTDTFGPVDLGLIYYYGYLKQPSVDRTAFIPQPVPTGTIAIDHDRVHIAGGEVAAALGPLNLRGEAAGYLTADTEGTDPGAANASVRYLAGFDIGIPFSHLSLNAQVVGIVTLQTEEIESNGPVDFEYDGDGVYTSHMIAASLRDTYYGEQITAELSGAWYVETGDYVIRPSVTVGFGDVLSMRVGGTILEGEPETYLGQYDANDFLEIEFIYDY